MQFILMSMTALLFTTSTYGQDVNKEADKFEKLADSLGEAKQYKSAAQHYITESNLRKMTAYKRQPAVNAAYYYAMAQMPDSAQVCFEKAVKCYGFNNLEWLDSEPALSGMRKTKRYTKLKRYMSERNKKKQDPDNAMLITSDIDLFWKVFDRYKKDTSNAQQLFLTEYFEKGSENLQEYYKIKTPNIGGINGFVRNIAMMPNFYESIRANTLQISAIKDTIRVIFRSLKNWYDPGVFPDATFVIGGWSSGGTVTDYGSIMGVDMQSADETTPTNELNLWQQKNLILFKEMKHVAAHELIHVQQNHMAGDTTLLCHAIKEGMADFIGELISGKVANQRLHIWALGREKKIWEEFKKEMFLNRYSNWIANSNQETPDRPADLGYWIGYQICKSYFDEAINKKSAISEMLDIQDYRAFLIKSKTDEKLLGR